MKKIAIILLLVLVTISAQAQNKMEKKANYFATEAVKEFKLDPSQKEAIYNAKLALLEAQKVLMDKKKNGEISDADIEPYKQENIQPLAVAVTKSIGKKWDEIKKFNKRMNQEFKSL